MGFGQIHDVQVVAHTCAIWRWVIIAKNGQMVALSGGNLAQIRHQVSGNAPWVLPDQARRMRAYRVEVPQQKRGAQHASAHEVADHILHDQLSAPVNVGGVQGGTFCYGAVFWRA